MIRPQSRPLQSKIWTAAPVPSINHAPSGTMAENGYSSYGPQYYGSDYNGSGYDGAGYYGYGR
jgi:hypothetical protein